MSGKNNVEMRIVRLPHGRDLPMPEYQSALAAGLDLIAAIPADAPVEIAPGGRALIPNGIAIALPAGHEGQIRPRSGLAARHGITVLNSPGTVDADYRGEVQVILINLGADSFVVRRGMRVAQLVVAPVDTSRNRRSGCATANRTRRRWARLNRTRHRTWCGIRQQARLIAQASEPFVASDVSLSSMSVLPRKALLAIAAVIEVALQGQQRPIAAKSLASRHGLPPRHLETVLQALVREGILRSIRGPRGGYQLARHAKQVSAADILRASGTVEGPEHEPASDLIVKVVQPALMTAESQFEQALSRISLDDVARLAESADADERPKKQA